MVNDLASRRRKTDKLVEGDKVMRVTYVQNELTSINEEGLKKAVGAKVWEKISDRKVSKPKLTEAIADGVITPELASVYLTLKPSRAYIRYSEGQLKEGDEAEDD